jgi:lipopolysaccharide transport system ATP-binding protein
VNSVEAIGLTKDFGAFRALDDVSFQIAQGETVGIIGRNGAGKSTLFQILAGILRPSAGKAILEGRVASILEVGTGFHPDLSGRENVFLNGQLLGLSRSEIKEAFDEIVAFSEIERFIDQPVKHYSSGMYLRLAFSIFAHLKSDVVLLDEVMGVGDAAFKRKCEVKMQSLANSGATILLINHDINSIQQVCNRCLFMENGKVVEDGPMRKVVSEYYKRAVLSANKPDGDSVHTNERIESGNGNLIIHQVTVEGLREGDDKMIDMSTDIRISFDVEKKNQDCSSEIIIRLDNSVGTAVLQDSHAFKENSKWVMDKLGRFKVTTVIPGNLLNFGTYYLTLFISENLENPELFDRVCSFEVERTLFEASSNWDIRNVLIRPNLTWQLEGFDQ